MSDFLDTIYLDYMATTPLDPKVLEQMLPYLDAKSHFGNAGSATHIYGWRAKKAVDDARLILAESIGAEAQEIIFTSGATEANNLAIQGAAHFYAHKGKHLITSSFEHKAVLDVYAILEKQGFNTTYLKPNSEGLISLDSVAKAITKETRLISLMWVNNEIGTIQAIHEIGQLAHEHGILMHVDAAQAMGKVEIDLQTLPVDLMSFSAHKAYGPKGSGALFVRRKPRARLTPLLGGGQQEQGLRPGTLATHQIVGMAYAFNLTKKNYSHDFKHIQTLSEQFWQGLKSLGQIRLNGSNQFRVPHNLNLCFEGLNAEALSMSLSELAMSPGSACNSATEESSHVLRAIGLSDQEARSSLRFSLGRYTTEPEITRAIHLISREVKRERALAGLD